MSVHPDPGMPETGEGRCLCGAVGYAWRRAPHWASHCHCESCRRATSSGMASLFAIATGYWDWTGAAPKEFESSPGVRRTFCDTCGSPVSFSADHYPGETHFYAGTMARPEDYRASYHVHDDERLPWMIPGDGLTRVARHEDYDHT